ncbi:adenosine deaminase [Lactobacillus crispatus]|jgi:adenosine deaminase|uniref:adenosine deaminase n=1 Tax=Lactobacillus crispatus TaxID=47770 RepID=UPI0007616B2E|nr:adenosine deaminase [Lactobacillus crispatus]KWU12656.1 adenosine deaminase [Lactobacillus crispatus]MCZ3845734.1 adenosine deaminase [Lactobacillus crispatus]MCZ3848003.1 adenosine deaminase [Lactobacillus crispatus]MCZ3853872.1 adenosine deaminase [Lactobacillus crispatus]MCZ3856148.1 adenosine deaminase [Lactobacillus crispatus]
MRKFIDLHLHLDGSVPVATVKKLMQEHGMPQLNDQELSVDNSCSSLEEFLEKFALPNQLMQTKHDLETIVFDLLTELKSQGLVYAEIRFAPQLHTKKGLTQKEVIASAIGGIKKFYQRQKEDKDHPELHAGLILCLMRFAHNNIENMETVELAKEFLGKGVVGLDLAGAEGPIPNINYQKFFQRAQDLDVPYTIHAGEASGPDSIRQALEMGAKRIGHGICCTEDPALTQYLIDHQIILECCATSNMNTKAFDQIDSYPIKKLLHTGMKVTLNSDDMTVSNTNLPHEYQLLEEKTALTPEEETTLYLNAVDAAFTTPDEKIRLRALIQK